MHGPGASIGHLWPFSDRCAVPQHREHAASRCVLRPPDHPVCRRPARRGSRARAGAPGGAPYWTNDLAPRPVVCSACPGSMADGMIRPLPQLLRFRLVPLLIIPESEAPAGGGFPIRRDGCCDGAEHHPSTSEDEKKRLAQRDQGKGCGCRAFVPAAIAPVETGGREHNLVEAGEDEEGSCGEKEVPEHRGRCYEPEDPVGQPSGSRLRRAVLIRARWRCGPSAAGWLGTAGPAVGGRPECGPGRDRPPGRMRGRGPRRWAVRRRGAPPP